MEYSLTDQAGDAFGGETDNGDLVGLNACRYQDGILLEVEYSELRTTATGMTQLFFDVDQNPATGESVSNMWGHEVVGAETSISFMWDISDQHAHYVGTYNSAGDCIGGTPAEGASGITAIQVHGATGDIIRGAEALVDASFATGRWRITVPYRALGIAPGTPVDVYAKTSSTYLCPVPYDEMNGGVLSIGATTHNVPPTNYVTLPDILGGTSSESTPDRDPVQSSPSDGNGLLNDWLFGVWNPNDSSPQEDSNDSALDRLIDDIFSKFNW